MDFLKKLIFAADETADEKPAETKAPTKFPDMKPSETNMYEANIFSPQPTQPVFSAPVTNSNGLSQEEMDKFVKMYESGFEGLNQAGYDFFEFYKAIIQSGGVDNPQMYIMAMSMGSAMDATMNKAKLLSQADFYVNEITKVYNDYVQVGENKKNTLVNDKTNENQTLVNELNNLKSQLEAINNQIHAKQNQLSLIDNKYTPQIASVEDKLRANTFAKDKIINSINAVKNGISNNIK